MPYDRTNETAEKMDSETLHPQMVLADEIHHSIADADDIASVLHYRVARATARPAGSGRARKAPRLIVGLIPEATGTMTTQRGVMENDQRARAIVTRWPRARSRVAAGCCSPRRQPACCR